VPEFESWRVPSANASRCASTPSDAKASQSVRSGRFADRIYVPKDGTIVESRSHDELMALGRLYAELYNLQASTTLNPSVRVVEQSLVPTRASEVGAHRAEL
jgi:hypothetical protein